MLGLGLFDLVSAGLTGLLAFALFSIHVVSSKAHQRWFTLPGYVRIGVLLTAIMCMIRSVNLLSLSKTPIEGPGHMNLEALLLTALGLYTVLAVVYWIWHGLQARDDRLASFTGRSLEMEASASRRASHG